MESGLLKGILKYVRGKGIAAESIRYVIVGALTTFLNYGLFELMYSVMGVGVRASNFTSIAAAILFAYTANKLFVFRRHSDSLGALAIEFCKFVGSRLFTMALEVGALELIHSVLGYSARLGKLAALVIAVISNYIISKALVFRSGSAED